MATAADAADAVAIADAALSPIPALSAPASTVLGPSAPGRRSEPILSIVAPKPEPPPQPERAFDDPDSATLPAYESTELRAPLTSPASSGSMAAAATPTPATTPAVAESGALPDPAAAAFEAARIAGEIVGDIESASGAAIVAAAAAGAAIEAVRARRTAEGDTAPPADASPADAPPADPVVTVRMQRDRILRALAEDVAATALAEPATARAAPARATSQSEATAEDADDPDDPDDPVERAAAAIGRLRRRARTDLAELRVHYHRHDLFVVLFALVVILVAGMFHRDLVTPRTTRFEQRGLELEHSTAWLPGEALPPAAPRIIRDPTGQPPRPGGAYHVAFTSTVDPSARFEVLIDKKPAWSNIVTGLELDRRTRYGELYKLDHSSVEAIAGHDWLRTAYRYAHTPEKGDVPRVDHALEYATIDRDQLYVVTLFGAPSQIDRIERVIAPSLRVPTQTGMPLVPQTRRLSTRSHPAPVARAFDSAVMVVVADLVEGRLRARGGGSGVIVGADGSILTNYHVIHDKDGRLHDVFVIGRFDGPDRAPLLVCAGRPSRSKLQRDVDLALIKCDTDLDGRTWTPASSTVWPTLLEARTGDTTMGQRLWVLGYPDVGGGGLTLSEGKVDGWTGVDGAAGRDFLKTDASIIHGNSGGPVVDDSGKLVGVASAYRTRVSASGSVVEVKQIGLVRPLPTASCLLAIAAVGWTPREGHTDCDLEPSAVEAPAEGVRIESRVVDAANENPVGDALVMVLRANVDTASIDVNRLDDQVLAWGRSNTHGEVKLKQPVPVPGVYTVMVVARGYEPLIGESALRLDAETPPRFDPWGEIRLRSR